MEVAEKGSQREIEEAQARANVDALADEDVSVALRPADFLTRRLVEVVRPENRREDNKSRMGAQRGWTQRTTLSDTVGGSSHGPSSLRRRPKKRRSRGFRRPLASQ